MLDSRYTEVFRFATVFELIYVWPECGCLMS